MIFFRFCFLIFLITACSRQEKAELGPEHEEIISIVQDLYIAEAVLSKTHLSIRDSMSQIYRAQILEMHEIDSTQLEIKLDDLKSNYRLYFLVHEEAVNRLKPVAK